MRAEQALLDAHFSQAKKVLGRNLQSAIFSKSARIFAERALIMYRPFSAPSKRKCAPLKCTLFEIGSACTFKLHTFAHSLKCTIQNKSAGKL